MIKMDSKENSRGSLYIEVKLTEVYASFREKLITILNGEVCSVSITLRNGRTIEIGSDPKRNPHNLAVEVAVTRSVQGLLAMISRDSSRSVERARDLSANLSCILCDGL